MKIIIHLSKGKRIKIFGLISGILFLSACTRNIKDTGQDQLACMYKLYISENQDSSGAWHEDPWTLSYIYYLKGDYTKAVEWEEKVVEGRYPLAYTMNLPIFYDKEYFEGREHQRILREMGFVK